MGLENKAALELERTNIRARLKAIAVEVAEIDHGVKNNTLIEYCGRSARVSYTEDERGISDWAIRYRFLKKDGSLGLPGYVYDKLKFKVIGE